MEDYSDGYTKKDGTPSDSLKRREFLKLSSATALTLAASPMVGSPSKVPMPMRSLGKTGESVSMLTVGGYHIGSPDVTEEQSIEIIRTAIDQGVNFLDNAWQYHKGRSETLMGQALKDGYREKVLLMTKFNDRSLDGIKRQLETSLKRMDIDRIDLMQFHHVAHKPEAVDAIHKNGLLQWAMDLRDQGVFKYLGFTGHSHPGPMIEMIRRGFEWDTIQFPVNIGDYHQEVSFERDLMPLAIEKNIGILAMKTNGYGLIGESGIATPAECIRYALSLPVSTVVSGIDALKFLRQNMAAVKDFTPYTEEELAELRGRAENTDKQLEHYRRDI